MKTMFSALAAGALLSVVSVAGAQALPVAGADALGAETEATRVAGGCGPGFRPNPWGRCVPFRGGYGYGPRAYGPRFYGGGPRLYGGPRCTVRYTPYGPRKVCF